MFFNFEGVDGSGKTTQARLFCQWLREQNLDVVACRDPGSTRLGEALRKILLETTDAPMHRRSEMLLYMAARAQLVEEVIRPALAARKTVVSDRFLLANVAYQGYAGGLDVDRVWSVGAVATGGIEPDLVFLLDITAEDAAGRLARRPDRIEARGLEFLRRVRQGYLVEAQRRPGVLLINAAGDIPSVQAQIRSAAAERLPGNQP
jgi:dTMP kinase